MGLVHWTSVAISQIAQPGAWECCALAKDPGDWAYWQPIGVGHHDEPGNSETRRNLCPSKKSFVGRHSPPFLGHLRWNVEIWSQCWVRDGQLTIARCPFRRCGYSVCHFRRHGCWCHGSVLRALREFRPLTKQATSYPPLAIKLWSMFLFSWSWLVLRRYLRRRQPRFYFRGDLHAR